MLVEVSAEVFNAYFPKSPHPFICERFLGLYENKVERIVRLIKNTKKVSIGLISGINDQILLSPFSAPFGGFHFTNNEILIGEIDDFLKSLKSYILINDLKRMELILPPDIYHSSFNAKMINSLLRNDFSFNLPEITSVVNLDQFSSGLFSYPARRNYYNQAVAHGLTFHYILDDEEREKAYEIVRENRARLDRPIFMTFDDIENISKLWKIDFFKVNDINGQMVASAIFYQNHPFIVFAVYWGDTEYGRTMRAMDFMVPKLYEYYKGYGFKYIDLSISTESGIPNQGLLRFKEEHYATSSLRFSFYWGSKK